MPVQVVLSRMPSSQSSFVLHSQLLSKVMENDFITPCLSECHVGEGEEAVLLAVAAEDHQEQQG